MELDAIAAVVVSGAGMAGRGKCAKHGVGVALALIEISEPSQCPHIQYILKV